MRVKVQCRPYFKQRLAGLESGRNALEYCCQSGRFYLGKQKLVSFILQRFSRGRSQERSATATAQQHSLNFSKVSAMDPQQRFTSNKTTTKTTVVQSSSMTTTSKQETRQMVQSQSMSQFERHGFKHGRPSVVESSNESNLSRAIESTEEKNHRPQSTLTQRGRAKNTRNSRTATKTLEYQEIESFKAQPGFADSAKGMKFGAPKLNTTISTKRHSKATTTTRSRKTIAEDGMMTSMPKFQFQEEETGPEIQQESLAKSRSVAVLRPDQSTKKPVPPTPQPKKNAKNHFTTATAKKKPQPKIGLGPGEYDLDAGQGMTRSRTKSALLSRTERPDVNRRSMAAESGDLGPGAYDGGKQFGKDVIGYTWGKPKPEKKIVDPRDYGMTPEKEFRQTRHKSPSAVIKKEGPARPLSFANQAQCDNPDAGTYKKGNNFGDKAIGYGFGKPKAEKREVDNRDYNADRDFSATRNRSPAAIINKSSPGRPKSMALDQATAPGQYDSHKSFGQEAKNMTFSKVTKVTKIEKSAGPGQYEVDRSVSATKVRTRSAIITKEKKVETFALKNQIDSAAPGQYDDGKRFNSDVKGFKIGEKRETKIKKTAGPGEYSPERAERQTKCKAPNIDLGKSPARPSSFAQGGDVNVAPGQYDDGKRFNSDVKGFRIGEKREKRIEQSTGPGAYSPERADGQTKNKMPNIDLGKSPARPQSFAKGGDVNVAPGQYNHEKKFGQETKSFRIGEKRETRIEKTAGPGEYNVERADTQTKTKMVNINMGSSPARPQSFAKGGDVDVAPGQYDDGKRFNSGVKSFKIGEKRETKIQKTAGPGEYSPELAERQTKSKAPNIDLGKSPARPQSFAKGGDVNVAPGQYDDGKRFNSDVKGFKIGEKRPDKPKEGMGPGAYSPERADAQTKTKMVNINLGSSPARPQSFAKGGDVNVAPGQYDDGKRFNSDVKGFRIGEKRETRIETTAGPGTYDVQRAEIQTKTKSANINLGSSPARPQSFAKANDTDAAPGQYDDGIRFNSGVKGFRIGEKREERIKESMGPGAYSPERADGQTKNKMPNINLGSSPARPQSFAKGGDVNVAPGQYNSEKRFGEDTKTFRIGEKREVRIEKTAGPGSYSPELAERQTKQKTPNIDLGRSPARPHSFAKANDTEAAPGQYDDGIRFNSGVKSFKIGEKREVRIEQTAGPGTYEPTLAEGQTKQKIPNIDLGKSPARPHSFAKANDTEAAPGQYDDGIRFNSGVKSFQIGEKREERIQQTAGPGTYSPERAEGITKQKTPNINLGSSPARPQSFAKGGDIDVAPGQYDDGKRFNTGVKSFKIGEKREVKIEQTAGPGTYEPTLAEGITKQKTPNINLGSSPARPQSFAKANDTEAAPGQYDDGIRFNTGVKSFKIGEKRETRIEQTAGPGTYSPELAERQIKQKTPNIDLGRSPARPHSFAKANDTEAAPGQYDDGIRFNQGVKSFKIGEKREVRIEQTAGPGTYEPTLAEGITKQKTPNINLGSSPARPQSFAKANDTEAAPGQYDDGIRFNSGVKSFKIGEKRETRIEQTAGPGTYEPNRAESLTKTKSPNINLGSSPSRPQSFAKGGDVDVAPGQYNSDKRFGEDTKSFRIGEKREVRIEQTAGPGTYEPTRADSQTKQKMPNINLGSSPARPQSFAKANDTEAAPGQYDDGIRFNTGVKSFKIGEKRETIIQQTAGPGTYSPERADSQTKQKMPNINLGSSPARPQSFAKANDTEAAPGQYDDGIRFNSNVKSFTIGEKRETRIQQTSGPGTYSPERADSQTKQKTPNIDLGRSPSRPQSFAKGGDVDVAPGQYNSDKRFGQDTKSFRIGEKREVRIESTAGPGSYEATRAENLTKSKSPNINLGSSPSRPSSFARGGDVDVAPGQYDDGNLKFANNVNGFTIGEKREQRIQQTVGPGEYDTDRADNVTKSKSPQVSLGNSPSRPGLVGQTAVQGTFSQKSMVTEQRNSFAASASRTQQNGARQVSYEVITEETKQDSTGPDVAEPVTTKKQRKTTTAKKTVSSSQAYNSLKPRETVNIEPVRSSLGVQAITKQRVQTATKKSSTMSSNNQTKTASKTETFKQGNMIRTVTTTTKTITTSSQQKNIASSMKKSSASNSLTVTKQTQSSNMRTKSAIKGNVTRGRTGRQSAITGDERQGPGTYDIKGATFSESTKGFTIGVKREASVERSPGPGEYDAQRSDSATKHRQPSSPDFNKQTGRDAGKEREHEPSSELTSPERFYNYPKEVPVYSIGEKRPEKPKEGPGPGEYDLNQSGTKPRVRGHHQF